MARPSCSSLLEEDLTASPDGPAHYYSTSRSTRVLPQVSYTKPDRKGKRRLLVEEEDDERPPKLTFGDEVYVEALAAKYGTNQSRPFQATTENQTESVMGSASSARAIKLRLVKNRTPCNIHNLNCDVPMCGRAFHDVEVLAFHMSYAHSDVSHLTSGTTCFVCGLQLNSAKGKVAHLTSRHRTIASDHNIQCLEQREPVMSPFAPAAIRLEAHRFEADVEDEQEPEIIYDNTTLADICDMIAIPHEDDYPPDQSHSRTWTD